MNAQAALKTKQVKFGKCENQKNKELQKQKGLLPGRGCALDLSGRMVFKRWKLEHAYS